MTNITFFKTPAFVLSGFTLNGHTGFAPRGGDILCAALSSTAEFTVSLLRDSFGVDCRLLIDHESVSVECLVFPSKANLEKKDVIFGVLNGYYNYVLALCGEYPKNISCKLTERNDFT